MVTPVILFLGKGSLFCKLDTRLESQQHNILVKQCREWAFLCLRTDPFKMHPKRLFSNYGRNWWTSQIWALTISHCLHGLLSLVTHPNQITIGLAYQLNSTENRGLFDARLSQPLVQNRKRCCQKETRQVLEALVTFAFLAHPNSIRKYLHLLKIHWHAALKCKIRRKR